MTELQRQEILRCGRDPTYFIRRYVKIRHPKRGLIPFDLYDYQERLLQDYQEHRFNVVLKARQLGITEVTAAYATWLMLFRREKTILAMATKGQTAKNLMKKVRLALSKVPKWMMLADIVVDNVLSVELSNGSSIKIVPRSADAGRSEAVSLLIVDEAAWIEGFEDIWVGLQPTVSVGGNIVMMSTPRGVGNVFHKTYTDAEAKKNEFHPTKLPWWRHPEHIEGLRDDSARPGGKTSVWFEHEIRSLNLSPREIAQEYGCCFNASGDTFVASEILDWVGTCLYTPVSIENWDRGLHVWRRYDHGSRYFITADVARGDGNDYSAFHAWEVETMEQVAEYMGKLPPDEYAELLCKTGKEYGECLLVVENNNVGFACLDAIRNLHAYPNVYYSNRDDKKPGEALSTLYGSAKKDLVIGFCTSPKSRPLIVEKLEQYLRNQHMLIRGERTLAQLRTFVWKDGKPQATGGKNDDLVVSAALGAWIRETFIKVNLHTVEMQKKMIENISANRVSNTDIPGASKDPRFVPRQTLGTFGAPRNPYAVRTGRGNVIDFSWLLKN